MHSQHDGRQKSGLSALKSCLRQTIARARSARARTLSFFYPSTVIRVITIITLSLPRKRTDILQKVIQYTPCVTYFSRFYYQYFFIMSATIVFYPNIAPAITMNFFHSKKVKQAKVIVASYEDTGAQVISIVIPFILAIIPAFRIFHRDQL